MFIPLTQPAYALSSMKTRTFTNPTGTSMYTLLVDSPDEVLSDSNWTITVSLILNSLTKLKLYMYYSAIIVTVELPSGKTLERVSQFGVHPITDYPDRLYPGGKWGPTDITFELAKEDLEITSSGSIDTMIFLKVDISENLYVLSPEAPPASTYETFRVTIGQVKIINSAPNIITGYLPFIIGGVTSMAVLIALLLYNRLNQRSVKY